MLDVLETNPSLQLSSWGSYFMSVWHCGGLFTGSKTLTCLRKKCKVEGCGTEMWMVGY